jgi:chromate transporter
MQPTADTASRTAQASAADGRAGAEEMSIPHESLGRLFLRFLRFGFLAWGGPVAQIAMLRKELVDEEKWVPSDRFNRTLALYQVLPGPEAHELCVWFGMLARGRIGGFLAGLGFMLPGAVLMFLLSWAYATWGITALAAAVFVGVQPAVVALVTRAIHRIGSHALHADPWLWGLAALAGVSALLQVRFWLSLPLVGLIYVLAKRGQSVVALAFAALMAVALVLLFLGGAGPVAGLLTAPAPVGVGTEGGTAAGTATTADLFLSGLKAGLLTFGGAYTVISYLQRDAVAVGAWMTNAQFLDGLALSGILPAPLIIFSTFVGYLGGGPLGALAMTVAIFAPAFLFTLLGHDILERLIENTGLHAFLDGVTAGVVGLITATTLDLFRSAVTDVPRAVIFAVALYLFFKLSAKWSVPAVILGAALAGLLVSSILG